MFVSIVALIFILIVVLLLISYALSGFSIAPWIPCKEKDLERINKLADLKPGQIFYELGCGDGRVSRYIAMKNPDVKVIGIEIFLPVFLLAKIISLFQSHKNLTIKFGDAFKENLNGADVVYTFALSETINGRLKSKFEKQLKKGAKVISYVFSIKNWSGNQSVNKLTKNGFSIFTYEC